MVASSSEGLTFFKEGVFMLISKDRIGLILARFSIVFTPPCPADQHDELAGIWHKVFDDASEHSFNVAALALLKRLKRFPHPADFVEELERMKSGPASTLEAWLQAAA